MAKGPRPRQRLNAVSVSIITFGPSGTADNSPAFESRLLRSEAMGVNGHPPLLEGATCDAVIRIEHKPQGELTDPCYTIYLCFDGVWHRLYFDFGVIFWREQQVPPEADASQPGFLWHDLGCDEGLAGLKLEKYVMSESEQFSDVIFYFTHGRRLRFVADASSDIATYEVL